MWNNLRSMRLFASALLPLLAACSLWAEVRLPTLFGDHMVVQRDLPVRVWGWADPGETIVVSFRGHQARSSADTDGRWDAFLPPGPAGGPFEMTVRGTNEISLEDVHAGEVWVASGQSNMVWPLERSLNAEEEIAAADHPGIRYFKAALSTADAPQASVAGAWRVVSPASAGELSGVAYFFARHLSAQLGVSFGIVQSAWGGTPAEAWTSGPALEADPELKALATAYDKEAAGAAAEHEQALAQWTQRAAKAKAAGTEPPRRPQPPRALRPQHKPAALFNAMVAPLTPYAIRGVIWYQGENNGSRGQGLLYRKLFRSLIEDWRREWGLGPFPFLFVQLANYARVPPHSTWPELREAQAKALGLINTGMAVTIDIGNSTDIHPRNKQDVGLRLALAARAVAYGETGLEHSGPAFRQVTREGSAMRLWFDHASGGLEAQGRALNGFEVAGPDGRFVKADARIEDATVLVSSPEVARPSKARYAWAADPDGNLRNAAGLPASPFRTTE